MSDYICSFDKMPFAAKRRWSSAGVSGNGQGASKAWRTGTGAGKAQGFAIRSAPGWYPGIGAGVRRGRGVAGFNYQGGVRRSSSAQGMRARTGGFTGIERKFYDSMLISAALTAPSDATGGEHNPSATICLNSMTQGDGEEQRDGRKATIQGVFVKGVISVANQTNQTVTDPGSKIYIALVLDTQTNGALLNSEDVFKNKGANGITAASPMRNMQFTQRFRILDTAELVMENPNIAYDGTNIEQQGLIQPFQLSSNLEFSTQYSGTTETIANITDNSLSIVAFCTNVGLVPTMSYNARIRFVG